jgi:hypothetical protein
MKLTAANSLRDKGLKSQTEALLKKRVTAQNTFDHVQKTEEC